MYGRYTPSGIPAALIAALPASASPAAGSSFSWASLGLMWNAGSTTSVTITSPAMKTGIGRLVTSRAQLAQNPCSALGGLTNRFGITRRRLIIPPSPIERMKGRGKMTMLSNPIATVEPDTMTERPACVIVSTSASSVDSPDASSSRKRKTMSSA